MFYSDWKMIWKVVSLLMLLGVTALGGAYSAAWQMDVIGVRSEALLNGPAQATNGRVSLGTQT